VRRGFGVIALVLFGASGVRAQQPSDVPLLERGCCLSDVEDGAKIEKLAIRGNRGVPDATIENAIATTGGGPWPWSEDHLFDKDEFRKDLQRIHVLYQRHGFFDAELESYTVEPVGEGGVRITLTVREGEPTRVDSLGLTTLEGDAEVPLQSLRERIPLRRGEVFNEADLQRSREVLEEALKNQGYAFAQVLLEYRIRKEERTASVTYTLALGDLYRFGDVLYDEETATADDRELIGRHLMFEPGDRYDLSEIDESRRTIFRLGLYRRIDLSPDLANVRGDTIDVRVAVAHAPAQSVSIGLGYGTEDRLRAQVSWLNRNLFGQGRQLEASTRYSSLERELRLTYRQPFVFRPGITFAATGFLRFEVEDNYTVERTGATAQTGFRIAPRWDGSLSLTIERDDFSDFDRGVLIPELGRDFVNPSELVFTQATLSYDSTDSLFNPSRGYKAHLAYQLAMPVGGADYGYHRITLEATHYVQMRRGWILALKALPGTIFTYGGDDARVPLFQRLFAGGATSVRGYGRRELGPKDDPAAFGQERDPEPIGGNGLLEVSAEVRFPIRGNLRGAAFVDAGNVWNDVGDIDPTDLEYAPGAGVRYETIVGPLRVDLARKIDAEDDFLPDWVLHLSIGHAF